MKVPVYAGVVKTCMDLMAYLQDRQLCAPRSLVSWWVRHVPRELNQRADQLAKMCLNAKAGTFWSLKCPRPAAISRGARQCLDILLFARPLALRRVQRRRQRGVPLLGALLYHLEPVPLALRALFRLSRGLRTMVLIKLFACVQGG